MNFASVITTAVLLLTGVATVGEFHTGLRNFIIACSKDHEIPVLPVNKILPGHLAYLAEHQKKVAVDSKEKMSALMEAIKRQKSFLQKKQTSLDAEIEAIESEKEKSFNRLIPKNLNDAIKVKLETKAKGSSEIENFSKFLEYCPDGECYILVANSEAPVTNEEREESRMSAYPA